MPLRRRCIGSRFPGGVHEIGHQGGGFAYDNEGPATGSIWTRSAWPPGR